MFDFDVLGRENQHIFPIRLMRTRFIVLAASLFALLPNAAFALEGIGPRISVSGTVQEVRITEKQLFNQIGGEYSVKAENGQIVTIVLQDTVVIISEGRLSRKRLMPADVTVGMQVRVRGWRVDSKTITASLFIIQNIELNPVLSVSGVLQGITDSAVTVLTPDGLEKSFKVTNETEVNIGYTLYGMDGLHLTGKQVLLTLNPQDGSQVRVIRITGGKEAVRTTKPTTVELKKR